MTDHFMVSRYDYSAQFSDCEQTLLLNIREVLVNGGYILGPAVSEFENELAGFLGGDVHAASVNSGTDALILALEALGIGPGDEVITVANTFHGTALAIRRVGATPVLVDCRPDTYLMDLQQAEASITERTRAVLPVHLYGQTVNMDMMQVLAGKYGLLVIEDCAQAIGALSNGTHVGTTSDAGCWSFGPAKNLAAAGDAGAITVRDPALARRLRLMRHFGQEDQNEHELLGHNSRLDTIQAMVLLHKLPHIDKWNARRAEVAASYRDALRDLPLQFQEGAGAGEHVYHLFQVRTQDRPQRDGLLRYLREANVDAVVRYPYPLHLQPAFHDLGYRQGRFPVSEALANETLCLPLHPSLHQDSVDYVSEQVHRFFGSA
jgi:dTDP-4-amino-4,6-dideoxygalactose transaminase